MPIFTWNDSYSVSVAGMDAQHKKLFALINQLHDAMAVGKARTILGEVINELLDYTRTHFTAEEKLLEKFNYAGLPGQKREHAVFIGKIVDIQEKFKSGSLTVSLEVNQLLRNWLTNHIQVVDKKYASFLKEKGEK